MIVNGPLRSLLSTCECETWISSGCLVSYMGKKKHVLFKVYIRENIL